jgi:hypothetical protein
MALTIAQAREIGEVPVKVIAEEERSRERSASRPREMTK